MTQTQIQQDELKSVKELIGEKWKLENTIVRKSQENQILAEQLETLAEIFKNEGLKEKLPPDKVEIFDSLLKKTEEVRISQRDGKLLVEDVKKALQDRDRVATLQNSMSLTSLIVLVLPFFILLLTIGLVNIFKPQIGLFPGFLVTVLVGIIATYISIIRIKPKVS